MVEYKDEDQLSDILKATSDTTRRAILTTLVQEGPSRVTDLAAYFDMSLNAVSKHIKVLEAAGLVDRKTAGRTHWISVSMEPVRLIDGWFSQLRSIWEMRLDRLDAALIEDDDMQDLATKNLVTKDLTMTVRRRINAPAVKVFNAWLDPKIMSRFMMGKAEMTVPVAETDPRVGGRFKVVMATPENEVLHTGEYKEITPHSRLVFTWVSPFSIEGSTVTLEFDDAGNGQTDVALTQVKFADEGKRDGHQQGWTHILGKLADVLA
jgi:uncharacterized protein YndB with AHSA1/START domain/DNA-binding MarR family transcriptional regulator